jgi:hypothetical protein
MYVYAHDWSISPNVREIAGWNPSDNLFICAGVLSLRKVAGSSAEIRFIDQRCTRRPAYRVARFKKDKVQR